LNPNPKPCLISCSVLKRELQQLQAEGKLDAELIWVCKFYHQEPAVLEKNLRKVIAHTKQKHSGKIVLVYGNLCLGQDGEMKKLADEFGIARVDAVNCIDCQLGGKGKFFESDPEHNLIFAGPGMADSFENFKFYLRTQGVDDVDAALSKIFSGIKGAVLLDTCGDGGKLEITFKETGVPLEVLETRKIGLDNFLHVIIDAIDHT
jgi:hypothetical protein